MSKWRVWGFGGFFWSTGGSRVNTVSAILFDEEKLGLVEENYLVRYDKQLDNLKDKDKWAEE